MTDVRLEPFAPPTWLRGPHAQTMIGRVLRLQPVVTVRRERWETPDGDFLDLDFSEPDADAPRGIVLVLHGLEGSSTRSYVRLTLAHLRNLGLRGIAMNFRSCSGELNRRARFYHSGETEDLTHVVSRVRRENPGLPVAAIGFSLGGNVLLKYLGETGEESGLNCAAVVSVPFDLAVGARLISTGVAGRVYTHYFLRSLKAKLAAKGQRRTGNYGRDDGQPHTEDSLDPVMVRLGLAARTLWAYDDAVTAPLHGFANAAAYYEASSAVGWIHGIRVPTVALHAADDPFQPGRYLPREMFHHNPHVTLHVTRQGGHLGFLASRAQSGSTTRVAGSDPETAPDARAGLRCWVEDNAARVVTQLLDPTF